LLSEVNHRFASSSADRFGCTFCKTTMADFRATGRWGCARCYTNFEAGIRELLRRGHGDPRDVGRAYRAPMSDTLERAAVLGELKDRLRRAIEGEQFELAADLRDRIRVLQGRSPCRFSRMVSSAGSTRPDGTPTSCCRRESGWPATSKGTPSRAARATGSAFACSPRCARLWDRSARSANR